MSLCCSHVLPSVVICCTVTQHASHSGGRRMEDYTEWSELHKYVNSVRDGRMLATNMMLKGISVTTEPYAPFYVTGMYRLRVRVTHSLIRCAQCFVCRSHHFCTGAQSNACVAFRLSSGLPTATAHSSTRTTSLVRIPSLLSGVSLTRAASRQGQWLPMQRHIKLTSTMAWSILGWTRLAPVLLHHTFTSSRTSHTEIETMSAGMTEKCSIMHGTSWYGGCATI